MEDFQLSDVWRDTSPTLRAFTHFSASAQSGARLDRWLLSASALRRFAAHSNIVPAAGIHSDHLPVALHLISGDEHLPRGKGLRGFPLLMLNMREAANDLHAWMFVRTQELLASPAVGLLQRFDDFKADILTKAWELYRHHRRKRMRDVRDAETAADLALRQLLRSTAPAAFPTLLRQVRETAASATAAWQRLAQRPRQAAATLDHMFGDCSSYFFHHQARAPNPPTTIKVLHRPGRGPDDPTDAADLTTFAGVGVGLHYAAAFYSSDSPIGLFRARTDIDPAAQDALLQALPRRLAPAQAALAEGVDGDSLLSKEELELALQMAARGSSPGHDGLPYEFYRSFRQVMLPVLLRVFNNAFLDTGSDQPLARSLRGVICLILKVGQPGEELTSYRPITLLNCDAKLVMLIMSNRLQRPLDYVIDIVQSAFLRGRDITDNIRYHLGLAARLQELGMPGWLLHSDLTKAYDTADRGWLARSMVAMGLRDYGIVRWCRILMGGSSSVVRVNGFLTAPFPTANGLPQGSALSCNEWVILLQPAVAYLNHLRSTGRIAGFALPSGEPAPAALAFADDTKSYVQDPTVDGLVIKEAFQLGARAGLPVQSVPKTRLLHLHGPVPPDLRPSDTCTHHARTGYRLQPLDTPHRLLGVPFGADHDKCTQAAFAAMPGAMRAAAATWLPLGLNVLGRSHVAMQCLGAKFVFQANFRAPTPAHLPAMQKAINRFVGTSSRAEEEAPFQGSMFPKFAASVLPHDKGGVSVPDLAAFSTAMLAKPGWLLFRHTAHPWQSLVRHEVENAFEPCDGRPLGFYRLVTDPGQAQLPTIPTRTTRSMVEAFNKLRVARIMAPASQDFESIMVELTYSNAVKDHVPVAPSEVSTTAKLWSRLRDVHFAYHGRGSLAPPERTALELIIARLPACWRTAVMAHAPVRFAWRVVSQPGVAPVVLAGPDPMSDAECLWELWPSGRLHHLPIDFRLSAAGASRAALVEARVKPKSAWVRADYEFDAAQRLLPKEERRELKEPWLVGVWDEMQLDPRVWGITIDRDTQVNILHLQVRHARRLAAHQNALDRLHSQSGNVRGYATKGAIWPALWAVEGVASDPAELSAAADADLLLLGIAGLEERWRRSAVALAAPAPADVDAVNRVPRWLDLSQPSSPRPSPADRAAVREVEPAGHPLRPGYTAVWTRLRNPTFHRPFRITCWRLLHGTLGCRAFLAHVRRRHHMVGAPDMCCQAASCLAVGRSETLTHALLDCPEVSPVIDWMLAAWGQLARFHPPPRSARVLLADDLEEWPEVPQDKEVIKMWTLLRVTTLGSIWRVRCARDEGRGGGATFARRVVSMVVDHIVAAIQRDWTRTQTDVRQMDDGAFCVDWWRGFDCSLSVDAFEQQWAAPPVFCKVVGDAPDDVNAPDTRTMELLIGQNIPVPWPDPPAPLPPPDPPPPPPPLPSPLASPAGASPSSTSSVDNAPACPICRRWYTATRPAVWTPCAHSFHECCLAEWLGRTRTCPVCRSGV
jgi:hypothetical protein